MRAIFFGNRIVVCSRQRHVLSLALLLNTYLLCVVSNDSSMYYGASKIFAITFSAEIYALARILFRLFAVPLLFRSN